MAANEQRNCMTCVMYHYNTNDIPEKITSWWDKRRDKILTEACNRCNDHSMWHDKDAHELTDSFVEELRIKLRMEEGI